MYRRIFALGLLLPLAAYAQAPGVDPCQFAGGCNPVTGRRIIFNTIQQLGSFFGAGAAGFAVLFVIIGGIMLMFSFGDEGQITKGRNAIIYAMAGFALALAAQVIVSFVVTSFISSGVVQSNLFVFDLMRLFTSIFLSAFNALLAVVFIIAGVRMVLAQGKEDEFSKAKNALFWAIIGAIIINVAHALVRGVFLTGFGAV